MTKQLAAQSATITTAAVQVQSLTIGRKQVTLAVFRQLRDEPLIAQDGTLNGVPWGAVNYHPDKCGDIADHWHIVWQRGTEFRRARVSYQPRTPIFWSKTGDKFISGHVREVLEGRGRYFSGTMPRFTESRVTTQIWGGSGVSFEMVYDESLQGVVRAWKDWRSQVNVIEKHPDAELYQAGERDCRARLTEAIERLPCAPPTPEDVDSLHDDFQNELKAEAARQQRLRDVHAAVAQLPQLFIAV